MKDITRRREGAMEEPNGDGEKSCGVVAGGGGMSATIAIEQRRLKYAATINDEALSEMTEPDYELQYIDIGNVDSYGTVHDVPTYKFEDSPSRARRIVRQGDVIISTVRTYLQAIAPIENPPENLIVSTGFAVVRPDDKQFDARFCKYALREKRFLWEVEGRSTGVSYPAINSSDLADIRINLPPLETQRLIADYLDRETARIDALVAEKEKMLALLEEKRAALISRAVIRGLNPDAPLKPSGLDWLGDIPAHWETVRLKHFAYMGYGLSQPPEYQNSGLPFVRATNVNRGVLCVEGLVYVDEADLPDSRAVRLRPGDLIVVRSGAYTGDSALVTKEWEGSILGYDMIIRIRRFCIPDFVSLALLSQYVLEYQINPLRLRAAQPHLNAEELGNLVIAVPPMTEQQTISNYYAADRTHIAETERHLRLSIELLKELRATLITAAVTGQISVEEIIP